jgi:hypothetical protein
MHDEINRAASADIGLVVEPPASGDDDVVSFGFRAERGPFDLHVESVMGENVSERRVANLVSELGYVQMHRGFTV